MPFNKIIYRLIFIFSAIQTNIVFSNTLDPLSDHSEEIIKRDANELRKFAYDLLSAVRDVNAKTPKKLKLAIAKNPEIVFKMVQSTKRQEFSEIISVSEIPVHLEGIPKILFDFFQESMKSNLFPDLTLSIQKKSVHLTHVWAFLKDSDRMILLNRIDDSNYYFLASNIRHMVDAYDFSKEQAIQLFKDPNDGIDLDGIPEVFVNLFHVMVDEYFNHYSTNDKIRVLQNLLKTPAPVDLTDKISAFLNASGPVVQKFFQLIGERVKSEKYKIIANKLKDQIEPVPFSKIKRALEKSYNIPLENIFKSFDSKPLASATIAQVHLAEVEGISGKVVVKVRRPGIKKIINRELTILRSLVKDPGVFKLLDSLETVIREEIDLTVESKYLKKGQIYRDKKRGIHVVKEITTYPAKENILIMELANGASIRKYLDRTELIKKAKSLRRLYEKWLKEALFGSGFFHADLHAGNLFFNLQPEKPGYELTLIDFGSVGVLTFEERKALIQLGLGIYMQKPELIVTGFRPFENMSCQDAKGFYRKIKKIIKNNKGQLNDQTTLVVNEAIKREFDISKNYLQFNRGKVFLEEHIRINNERLDQEGLQGHISEPSDIYVNVLLRKIPRIIKNLVFQKDSKHKSIIDKFTMKIAWGYVSSKYLKRKIKIMPFDICKGRPAN